MRVQKKRAHGQANKTKMQVAPGQIIDERFRIIERLGRGGFGMVYKAEQLNLGREVAIKFIDGLWQANDETRERMQREALVLSELKHKNIVALYGCSACNEATYLVLELATGRSLAQALAEQENFSLPRVINIAEQVCQALQHAHNHGIIHRDLKPGNVMLTANDAAPLGELVRVIDFGLAKLLPDFGKDMQKLTRTGATVGSVLYMSPEQCKGTVERRSDIYSLGVILYECVSGRTPFAAPHDFAVMYAHIQEQVQPLAIREGDDVHKFAQLQGVILKALAKNPADRYQTADEMLEDLGRIKSGSSEALTATMRVSGTNIPQPTGRTVASKRLLIPGLIAGVALIGTMSAFTVFHPKQANPAIAGGSFNANDEAADIYWRWRAEQDKRNSAYLLPDATWAERAVALKRLLDLNDKDHSLDHLQHALVDIRAQMIFSYFGSQQMRAGWEFMQSPAMQEYKQTEPFGYSMWITYAGSNAARYLMATNTINRDKTDIDVILAIRRELRAEMNRLVGNPKLAHEVLEGLIGDLLNIDFNIDKYQHEEFGTDCELMAKFPVEQFPETRMLWIELGDAYDKHLHDSARAVQCYDEAARLLDTVNDEQEKTKIRLSLAASYNRVKAWFKTIDLISGSKCKDFTTLAALVLAYERTGDEIKAAETTKRLWSLKLDNQNRKSAQLYLRKYYRALLDNRKDNQAKSVAEHASLLGMHISDMQDSKTSSPQNLEASKPQQ